MLNNEQELATLRKKVKKLKQENKALKELVKKFVKLMEAVVRRK